MAKSINLSESVIVALESMKQVLEVYLGFEVNFCASIQIEKSRIKGTQPKDDLSRTLVIRCSYRKRLCSEGDVVFEQLRRAIPLSQLYASVDLSKKGWTNWYPENARIYFGNPEKPIIELYARWDHSGSDGHDYSPVKVFDEKDYRRDGQKQFYVGHGIADRHFEPLSK